MSANTHTGEVSLRLGRKDYRLRYTWAALAQLRADFGQDYDAQISTAILEMNLEVMARVLVIGLEANHAGKFDVEKIMQLSPPVEPVISAVNSALNLAYHGMEALPENPPTAAAKILSRILSGISLRKHGKQPAAGD